MGICFFDTGCLLHNAAWFLSLLSHIKVGMLNLFNRHLASLLNRSMARLGSPELIGIDLICNEDIYKEAIVS